MSQVSAKTGINVEDAFGELTKSMRDRLLLAKMDHYNDTESDNSDELAGGFHVDGVVASGDRGTWACCSGSSQSTQPKAEFV
jgi:hypothetical protein